MRPRGLGAARRGAAVPPAAAALGAAGIQVRGVPLMEQGAEGTPMCESGLGIDVANYS